MGERRGRWAGMLGTGAHLGDMDVKVAGTKDGMKSIQRDLKTEGISVEIMQSALEQARVGRLHILDEMLKVLPSPREAISRYAPKITHLLIDEEKIGGLIGPGGRNIKGIAKETGCSIDVDEDGVGVMSGSGKADLGGDVRMVRLIAEVPAV